MLMAIRPLPLHFSHRWLPTFTTLEPLHLLQLALVNMPEPSHVKHSTCTVPLFLVRLPAPWQCRHFARPVPLHVVQVTALLTVPDALQHGHAAVGLVVVVVDISVSL